MEGTGANLRMTTNLPFQAAYEASGSAAHCRTVSARKLLRRAKRLQGSCLRRQALRSGLQRLEQAHQAGIHRRIQLDHRVSNQQHAPPSRSATSVKPDSTSSRRTQRNQLHNPCIINGVVQGVQPRTRRLHVLRRHPLRSMQPRASATTASSATPTPTP